MFPTSVTFVTSYFDVYSGTNTERTVNWRIQQFHNIAKTGIPICLYTSSDLIESFREFPNVKIMKTIDIRDTWTSKTVQEHPDSITLPDVRNLTKDTKEYILCMNAKLDFMADTILENPWNSTHFAWIDFSISYIFKDLSYLQRQLKILSSATLSNDFLAIPGCWKNSSLDCDNHYTNNVNWRFCGGFFLGNEARVRDFCQSYRENFPRFLNKTKKLVWEVNIWAWMEHHSLCNFNWYKGDHTDLILAVPEEFIYGGCSQIVSVIRYPYPEIKHFHATSPTYICHEGRHWLNTRYVNYSITPNGGYIYLDGSQIIKNHNIVTELFLDTDQNLLPITNDFRIMDEITVRLPELTPNSYSLGLEDIRIYSLNGRMRFIATNLNYSPVGRNRMVVGDYDPVCATYANCLVVIPPNPMSVCEKNWTPIVRQGEELFIYQWSPMEIGKIVDGHLVIVEKIETPFPWFDHFRGSTIFEPLNGEDESMDKSKLIGLVHFSIEGRPRHYYHCLVVLDSVSFKPLCYSTPFYFLNRGIEFCLGFTVQQDNYIFWISQCDRDPVMITVSKKSFRFLCCDNIV